MQRIHQKRHRFLIWHVRNSAYLNLESKCWDVVIGQRVQELFEQCWQQDGRKESLDFATTTCFNTSHDSLIMDGKKGALRDAFEKAARLG